MANKRIFYAVQQVGIAPIGITTFGSSHTIHGLQSVGINTNFNLEQIFEIGQLEIYENVEQIPEVEITLEKVLDGYPLIYHLATSGSVTGTIAGRSNKKCQVALSIFSDDQDAASGTPLSQCVVSGAYVSSLNYNFPADGSFSESVTLVCNNKIWKTSAFTFTGQFDNTDTPRAISGSGGVNRREDFIYDTGASNYTILPPDVDGISSSGTNNLDGNGDYGAHVQSAKVSTSLGRDQLVELGRRLPYHRYVNFPVEVRTDIEVISTRGDMVEGTEDGVEGDGSNLLHRHIRIKAREGTVLELGTKNKLSTVTYGNANAGAKGGNATVTYSFLNFNTLTVSHPQDPSGL